MANEKRQPSPAGGDPNDKPVSPPPPPLAPAGAIEEPKPEGSLSQAGSADPRIPGSEHPEASSGATAAKRNTGNTAHPANAADRSASRAKKPKDPSGSRTDKIKTNGGDLRDSEGFPISVPIGVLEATLEYWAGLSENERMLCYNTINVYYHNLIEEFRTNANQAVVAYSHNVSNYQKWRVTLIIATGGLALVNVLAAGPTHTFWGAFNAGTLNSILTQIAALYAVILALLTNLESYYNYSDRKATSREARELYLDSYRSFEMFRLTHVYPYGYSPHACYNFNILYGRLIERDIELRRKIMQLASSKPGNANSKA